MVQADPQVALGVDLAQQFIVMVRHRKEERLDSWLDTVKTSGLPALISFANDLLKDFVAVRTALHYPWSNGQTERQVNRLKFIKRSMYGRANFDLLRKRGWAINQSKSRTGFTAPNGRSDIKLNRTIRFQAYNAKRINMEALVLPCKGNGSR